MIGWLLIIKSKNSVAFILCTSAIAYLAGCVANNGKEDVEYYYTFTDSLDSTVNLKDKPQRVVSLVGSYAETWMLAGGELVGVTNDVITERGMDVPEGTRIVGTIKRAQCGRNTGCFS